MKKTLLLAAAAIVVVGAPALAFHDGGVAHCNGCHTMHNSQDGAAMNSPALAVGQGYDSLLLYADATSVCLDCHDGGGSYHIWSADPTAPNATTANRGGGDFVFLEEDNLNDGHGGGDPANFIPGHAAGHNVITALKGIVEDPVLSTAPGGTYPASDLACTSCHDPHGTGSYRILYQSGQSISGAVFTATIDADGIALFGAGESNSNHNAYKSGFSDWCATCHTDFHQGWVGGNLIHPSGEAIGSDIADAYNAYMGSTDCAMNPPIGLAPCGSGTGTGSYLHVVPFEDAAMTTSYEDGANSTSRVACMTCHRAHATSAPDAGRWDFSITGLEEDGHESLSYKIPNPYADTSQRSLCNKCHSQDEFDEIRDFTP